MAINTVKKYRNIYLNEPNPYVLYTKIDDIKGYDERFPKNETINHDEIYNINRFILIKNIIKNLNNSDNSIITKMNILNKYSFLFENYTEVDIEKGGLFDDFNFEID